LPIHYNLARRVHPNLVARSRGNALDKQITRSQFASIGSHNVTKFAGGRKKNNIANPLAMAKDPRSDFVHQQNIADLKGRIHGLGWDEKQ
jgi:hypothetical protein